MNSIIVSMPQIWECMDVNIENWHTTLVKRPKLNGQKENLLSRNNTALNRGSKSHGHTTASSYQHPLDPAGGNAIPFHKVKSEYSYDDYPALTAPTISHGAPKGHSRSKQISYSQGQNDSQISYGGLQSAQDIQHFDFAPSYGPNSSPAIIVDQHSEYLEYQTIPDSNHATKHNKQDHHSAIIPHSSAHVTDTNEIGSSIRSSPHGTLSRSQYTDSKPVGSGVEALIIPCESGNSESSFPITTMPRHIPGPAGQVGCFELDARATGKSKFSYDYRDDIYRTELHEDNPDRDKDYFKGAWLFLLNNLQISPQEYGDKPYSKEALLRSVEGQRVFSNNTQTVTQMSVKQKVPILAVLVKSIGHWEDGTSCILKDPFGTVEATIHPQVMKKYPVLGPGASLLLRGVSIFSSIGSGGPNYLNVVLNNVQVFYPASTPVPDHLVFSSLGTHKSMASALLAPCSKSSTQACDRKERFPVPPSNKILYSELPQTLPVGQSQSSQAGIVDADPEHSVIKPSTVSLTPSPSPLPLPTPSPSPLPNHNEFHKIHPLSKLIPTPQPTSFPLASKTKSTTGHVSGSISAIPSLQIRSCTNLTSASTSSYVCSKPGSLNASDAISVDHRATDHLYSIPPTRVTPSKTTGFFAGEEDNLDALLDGLE